ncbi:hypothetical protein RSOL_480140 [Rhizoctonia solani AG-3 Rhs1AP]|uniref:Uncharacterized protein n=1 Tax=Rhizoctonia solani AG-3 Rhs1AP TaxID=1086054 RepID=X8JJH2_9AGAM|nr:hypothetical protein RSOL_480140 [Rhizoctonia solani AG-3 Rhs1AP]
MGLFRLKPFRLGLYLIGSPAYRPHWP